jgi:molecular chaperone DnaK
MAKDADSHAADDRKRRDLVEARNKADAMVYNTEKTLKEHRDKVSTADAQRIEEALAATKKAMDGGDADAVNKAVESLTEASHKLAEAMYKAASAQPGDGAGAGPQAPPDGAQPQNGKTKKDDVVDAEFVDVDDKGKS